MISKRRYVTKGVVAGISFTATEREIYGTRYRFYVWESVTSGKRGIQVRKVTGKTGSGNDATQVVRDFGAKLAQNHWTNPKS